MTDKRSHFGHTIMIVTFATIYDSKETSSWLDVLRLYRVSWRMSATYCNKLEGGEDAFHYAFLLSPSNHWPNREVRHLIWILLVIVTIDNYLGIIVCRIKEVAFIFTVPTMTHVTICHVKVTSHRPIS